MNSNCQDTEEFVSLHRKLETVDAAKNFMLAGKAIFTLKSLRSGTHYTFKVSHKKANGQYGESWMVSLLTGPDNWANYTYIGQIKASKGDLYNGNLYFATTKASELSMDSAPVAGFMYAFRHISRGMMPKNLEIWHAGKCGRCGRLLTVPSSIELGLGPECASKGF